MAFVAWGLTFLAILILPLHCLTVLEAEPPKPWQAALMARYVMHRSDWVSLATISTMPSVISYPFVNLKSMSDGPISNGTGTPYLYMTHMDLSGTDIEKDNRVTIMATLAQSEYCKSEDLDPQDPRCARVILPGRLVTVDNSTTEYTFAKDSLYARHPSMRKWPAGHDFYVAKIIIEQVMVLDHFGGVTNVTVEDYYNASIDSDVDPNVTFDKVVMVQVIA